MKKIATVSCCAPGSPPLRDREVAGLATRFKALADPTRLAIVNRLAAKGETCVCELNFGVSQPTVSHHLKVLREAGLVDVRRRGTWAYYRLVPEALRSLAFALSGAPEPELVLATAEATVAR